VGKGGRRYPIEYAEGRELDFASLLWKGQGRQVWQGLARQAECDATLHGKQAQTRA
jgi:hypothetical protein